MVDGEITRLAEAIEKQAAAIDRLVGVIAMTYIDDDEEQGPTYLDGSS